MLHKAVCIMNVYDMVQRNKKGVFDLPLSCSAVITLNVLDTCVQLTALGQGNDQ